MQPPLKRPKISGAQAEAPVLALCVPGIIGAQAEAPVPALCVDAIDDANLAPEDIPWLETTLTKFQDGIATTDVTEISGHLVCQWHHKRLFGGSRRVGGDCKRSRYSDGRCIAHVAWQCVSTHRSGTVKEMEARMKETPGIIATRALIAEARSVVAELKQSELEEAQVAFRAARQEATALKAGEEQAAAQKVRDDAAIELKLKHARVKVATAHEATNQCKSEAANHLATSLIDSAIPTEALMEVFTLAQEAANRQDDDLSAVQASKWLEGEFLNVKFILRVGTSEAAVAAAERLWEITEAIFKDKVGALSRQADAFKEQDRKFVAALEALKLEEEAAVGAAKAATAAAETTAAVESEAATAARTEAAALATKASALETEAAASAEMIAKAATVPLLKDLAMLWAAGIIINAVRERGERHTNH